MQLRWCVCFGLMGVYAVAQTPDVGTGAPDVTIQNAFIAAYERNGFFTLVGAPTGNVVKYGTTGLIQQFPAVNSKTATLALIKPDTTDTFNVFQVQAAMFAYYSTISVGTAGYPTSDTLACPALLSFPGNSCQWQPFSSNYALFVYASALPNTAQNFGIRDPFYTKWNNLGGVSRLGPANSAETSVTSQFKSAATFQTYDKGAIYNITSGVLSGRLLAVQGPIYTLYASNGGQAGSLGLPATDELLLPNGMHQQTFEGGAIQLDPSTGIAVLRPRIDSLVLAPMGSIHLNLGDTRAVQVTAYTANGVALTDRTVGWSTSNGRVVQIQASGYNATLKAVGAGTAVVTVSAEGKTSSPLTVSVTAPCCQIGEGAPTAAIQQAFQDAVNRDKLSVQLPAAAPALRVGSGYVQQLLSTAMMPVTYLVAVADGSINGYVVTGAILAQYNTLGGPAGMLGYPLSDATAGARQAFQQGALAGNPAQLVTGAILAKWGALGYETGVAGSPIGGAMPFQSFRGISGSMQAFQNALIVAIASGPLSGQTFAVSGLVLAQYNASGGPNGDMGAPTDDEHGVNGLRQQDFEGGYISYAPGDAAAVVSTNPRQPLITTPGSVIGGTPVHLVVGGFNNGATVLVSETGQPDFLVTVANGAYAWDVLIPISAPNSTIVIRATDVNSSASAQGSYTVRSASSAPLTISILSGDAQTGAPGAQLAQPLMVVVKDGSGNPVPGQTVTFAASPGAQVTPASAVTGANGQASVTLRMPMPAGVALATAQVAGKLVTFSAKSVAFSLTNFPALTQAVDGALGNGSDTIRQKGALLTAAASMLRYYQSLNQLPQPNGLADPATLNQFLKSFCTSVAQVCDGFVSLGQSREQTVNLWRLNAFVGGSADVDIESADLNHVRDLVAAGSPVLLALSLNGLGSHFVVARGIASDGGLVIADPNPAFGQTNLNAYLNGFRSAGGGTVQGTVVGAVRVLTQAPSATGFLVMAGTAVSVSSVSGFCGATLQFPDAAAVAGSAPATPPGLLFFTACDGSSGAYQLDVGSNATFTDLSANGAASSVTSSSSSISRNGAQWVIAPLQASIAAGGVVNAASFTADVVPGGIISIYGAGFVRSGFDTVVQINGETAPVLAALPFQINAQIPLDIAPGTAMLSVATGNGNAQQSITVASVAPAIFSITQAQAAIANLDNSLNSPSNPALRGSAIVVYCTGLGAVSPSGDLSVASTPVTVVLGGAELPTAFAGLTPGLIGLYQVNVLLPTAMPPGLYLPFYLKQAAAISNTVTVAIQ
jgi:uncharacterized protein (TIGR03437 family)